MLNSIIQRRAVLFLVLLFAIPAFAFIPTSNESDEHENTNFPDTISPLVSYIEGKGLDIRTLLDDPRFELYDRIADRFRNAAEIRFDNLDDYKKRINYQGKKDQIAGFIITHETYLAKAEEEYDIPRYVIAAIIGVESDFGRVTGRYNPFNAYVSMFNEGYRANFAQAQLEELLIFASRNDIDVFDLPSSYAGAVSYAQFIPYSLNRWFVGSDLFNMENNIYSVANYLAHFKNVTGNVEQAVFRYNPSRMYTDAVLDLAKDAEQLMKNR